jgi:VWFA-related protein
VNRTLRKLALIILVVIWFAPPITSAVAQTQGEIRINLITTLETPDAMILKLYFNLYDASTGTPVLTLNSKNAQITLLNTNFVAPAVIKEPDVPIYITLVLDSSGSMGGAAQKLQEAAKLALSNVPADSLFAVVQFDEEIKLLQDFTENIPAVSYAIDQYKVSNKGTCLYDAAYAAVEAQSKAPPGRRAVILFTDGKDEKRDGSQCSKHSYQELVALAMQMQVPIHNIGLSSDAAKINELELKSMASSTGGFSFIANQADLTQAFAQIMAALKAQWMVEASVYPKKGQNEAVFSLTLADGGTMNTAFSFNSETDYPGPPSPVQVQFAGLQLVPETQSYDVQLTVASPELVSYVKISLWDKDAGSKVADYVFENPVAFNTFTIPTDQMTADRQYELRIIAVSKADNTPFPIFTDDQGKITSELIHEFRFDPTSIYASATIASVTQEGSDLKLNVTLTNPDMVGGFDGWLVNEATNTQVPNSGFTSPPLTGASGSITVPVDNHFISAGKYTVVLRVLGKNGQVFTSTNYDGIVYTVSAASLTIVSVQQDGGDLVLNVSVAHPEMIGSFDGWLVNKETNTQVTNSNFTIPAGDASKGKIVIPTNKQRIPNGKYTVIVRVLDAENQVLQTTQYDEVTYKAPTLFQRLAVALIAAPIILAFIVGIIMLVVVYLMVSSSRQKSLTGTPVMQGRLGGGLKSKGKADGLSAIADDEPLPSTRRPAQAAPPPAVPPPARSTPPASTAAPADRTMVERPQDRTMIGSENGATLIGAMPALSLRPFIVGLRGPMLGQQAINNFPFTIGRSDECSLTIADANVSRKHAQITCDPSGQNYFVTDLNSSNGSKVNGQRLIPGQATPISNGTLMDIGTNVSVRFDLK